MRLVVLLLALTCGCAVAFKPQPGGEEAPFLEFKEVSAEDEWDGGSSYGEGRSLLADPNPYDKFNYNFQIDVMVLRPSVGVAPKCKGLMKEKTQSVYRQAMEELMNEAALAVGSVARDSFVLSQQMFCTRPDNPPPYNLRLRMIVNTRQRLALKAREILAALQDRMDTFCPLVAQKLAERGMKANKGCVAFTYSNAAWPVQYQSVCIRDIERTFCPPDSLPWNPNTAVTN